VPEPSIAGANPSPEADSLAQAQRLTDNTSSSECLNEEILASLVMNVLSRQSAVAKSRVWPLWALAAVGFSETMYPYSVQIALPIHRPHIRRIFYLELRALLRAG